MHNLATAKPRVMEPGWEVWEEEVAEAHLKDHNVETPVGNISLPGEYFIYTFCLKGVDYRQRVAHRQ